jgi:arsenate reductase
MPADEKRPRVLFLCVGNSCRSQMAEGWARSLKRGVIEPYSAGTKPRGLDPLAVRVMAEVGVDVSNQKSKSLESLKSIRFDYVITLCNDANEQCPFFPGSTKMRHVGFDDPPTLARSVAAEEEVLAVYRRVRDEIRTFIETLPGSLEVP